MAPAIRGSGRPGCDPRGQSVIHLTADAVDQPLGDRREDVVARLEIE
jgi:hypothetical protein